jgi:hypothetical protein
MLDYVLFQSSFLYKMICMRLGTQRLLISVLKTEDDNDGFITNLCTSHLFMGQHFIFLFYYYFFKTH